MGGEGGEGREGKGMGWEGRIEESIEVWNGVGQDMVG